MYNFFITQPYLLSKNPSEYMDIVWILSEQANSYISFGEKDNLSHKASAQVFKLSNIRIPNEFGQYSADPQENEEMELWQYIARIDTKSFGERIYYKCISGNTSTKIYDFKAPSKDADFSFSQLSDLQALPGCVKVAREIATNNPNFILYSGDCVSNAYKATEWFNLGADFQDDNSANCSFFGCLQADGVELLQRCPLFICPGNHEHDDLRVTKDKAIAANKKNYNWSVYMQLFRPLYDLSDTTLTGKRYYSADYADLHIVSLSVQRHSFSWNYNEAPGWRVYDSIEPNSPQYKWLCNDLENCTSKYKWVIMHWHLLNKGSDVQPNLCNPVIDENGNVDYPTDGCKILMELFEKNGINGVSFGHSHVYERYVNNGTTYIEAAYFIRCYREENAPAHPSGLLPVVDDVSQPSYLIVKKSHNGLSGTTSYFSYNNPKKLKKDLVFDEFTM